MRKLVENISLLQKQDIIRNATIDGRIFAQNAPQENELQRLLSPGI